jgi:mono/diheme cytochrome c family protein/nitrate reductase cytochrome c-type subunit
MEAKLLRFYKILTVIFGAIFITFVLISAIDFTENAEWEKYQSEYEILLEKEPDETNLKAAQEFPLEIRQIVINSLNKVDRCVSCHLGTENPKMTATPNPFKTHSGKYLEQHSSQEYGCTFCHKGEGRALKMQEVCAAEEKTNLRYPITSLRYIQSSCGRCHLSIFENSSFRKGAEKLHQGLGVFRREGCLGCHKVRGVGGIVGPDLTDQGNKSIYQYSYKNVEGERSIPNWLREHFVDPQIVSPGSQMLGFELNEDEMDALVVLSLGLYKPDLPLEYYDFRTVREFRASRAELEGEQIYALFCSACHGKSGEGKEYRKYKVGVPTLNNSHFQATSSKEFIEFTVREGRSRRQMASWIPELSGLTDNEIGRAVDFISNWKETAPSFIDVKNHRGNIDEGLKIFHENCSMCHGENGEGGFSPTLNNQDFLSLADDRFLYKAIAHGRSNTAMPSWSRLSAKEISNLLVLIRSWQKKHSLRLPTAEISGIIKKGQKAFNSLCVRCHGEFGSGGIGPAILNKDFLEAASDHFLLESIKQGREHTPMFGWTENLGPQERLSDDMVRNVVAFMRSSVDSVPKVILPGMNLGNPSKGKILFEKLCSECHGNNGEGREAPALNNQEFLSAASNGFIFATVSMGRQGTVMPSWGRGTEKYQKLTIMERNDLVGFIRSWQKEIIRIEKAFLSDGDEDFSQSEN